MSNWTIAEDMLLQFVSELRAELASMRQCFDAADRERSELRERAERAEAERDALRARLDPGMTLRDYYIAHAPSEEIADLIPQTLEGFANYIGIALSKDFGEGDYQRDYLKARAKARCEWADAMLAERETK